MRRPGPVNFSLCEVKGDELHLCGNVWHLVYLCEDGRVCESFHRAKREALAELNKARG